MYGRLASTGAAGVVIGGVHFGLGWFVAAAVLLVIVGVVLYRVGARRRSSARQAS